MMKFQLALVVALFVATAGISQTDTTYRYYTVNWDTSTKDSAFYITEIYKQNDAWVRASYWAKDNKIIYLEHFQDKDLKKRHGLYTKYYEDGSKETVATWDNGKHIESTWYFPNGNRKAYAHSEQKISKGWDESGNEIPNYITEQEARFNGSFASFLRANLDANVAAEIGAPEGIYTVTIKFVVDKEGNVTDAYPTSVPKECAACAVEALRVINKSPKWVPAIQNNKPVKYQAIQSISFVVEETKQEKKTKKRGLGF